ncbi:hypothetical protein C7S13_2892 [Burkholderia cepacia]|nr:hypothetical protein [Burkholderia cepacia]
MAASRHPGEVKRFIARPSKSVRGPGRAPRDFHVKYLDIKINADLSRRQDNWQAEEG